MSIVLEVILEETDLLCPAEEIAIWNSEHNDRHYWCTL